MSIFSKMHSFFSVNWFKTIVFNFAHFSIKDAVRIPVFIYRRTRIENAEGKVQIEAPIKTGMIRIGPRYVGVVDPICDRTIFQLSGGGKIILRGTAYIGRGSKICIGKNATLALGDNFRISGRSSIICNHSVSFGENCLLSWDILMMDTDFHRIFNEFGEEINKPSEIFIGNHVWIGCRATVMKGVSVADGAIIAANSIISKSLSQEKAIYGGFGKNINILRENIKWVDK